MALLANKAVSTHVFLAFEKCIALRDDLNKNEKKLVIDQATAMLREFGEPPDTEDDDLSAAGDANVHGRGVMHGAFMSQRGFSPAGVTASIYRALFPAAPERAKPLFKDWSPPVRPASPEPVAAPPPRGLSGRGAGLIGGSRAVAKSDASADDTGDADSGMGMAAFMGGAPPPMKKAPKSASGSGAGATKSVSRKVLVDEVEEEEEEEEKKPVPVAVKRPARRRRGGDDDDDAPPPRATAPAPAPAARKAPVFEEDDDASPVPMMRRGAAATAQKVKAAPVALPVAVPVAAPAARNRRRRGDDDDE